MWAALYRCRDARPRFDLGNNWVFTWPRGLYDKAMPWNVGAHMEPHQIPGSGWGWNRS